MKTQLLSFSLLTLLIFGACKPTQTQLKTKNDDRPELLPVEGRNSWRWKRQVHFGEFTARDFKGGWVGSHQFDFYLRFKRSKEKFSFWQYDGAQNKAYVAAVNRFKSTEIPVVRDYFSIPIDYQQVFAGSVYLTRDQKAYDFWLNFPDANTRITRTDGFIQTPSGNYKITGIQQLEGMRFKLPGNLGYHFEKEGAVVATIDARGEGQVHLSNALDTDTRLVLAAVANALLQRTQ